LSMNFFFGFFQHMHAKTNKLWVFFYAGFFLA